MNNVKLDREEKELLESFESGKWSSVRDRKTEIPSPLDPRPSHLFSRA